jgi:hypothetical protein
MLVLAGQLQRKGRGSHDKQVDRIDRRDSDIPCGRTQRSGDENRACSKTGSRSVLTAGADAVVVKTPAAYGLSRIFFMAMDSSSMLKGFSIKPPQPRSSKSLTLLSVL